MKNLLTRVFLTCVALFLSAQENNPAKLSLKPKLFVNISKNGKREKVRLKQICLK